jgi:hypothetical protein
MAPSVVVTKRMVSPSSYTDIPVRSKLPGVKAESVG